MTQITIRITGLREVERKLKAIDQKLKGTETRVGNNLHYAPLVGSSRFQTRTHRRTGWQTDEMVLRQELPAIVRDFEQAVAAAIAAPVISTNPLIAPARRAGLRLKRRMQFYPPAPPNSRYRRTGTYGRRWSYRVRQIG